MAKGACVGRAAVHGVVVRRAVRALLDRCDALPELLEILLRDRKPQLALLAQPGSHHAADELVVLRAQVVHRERVPHNLQRVVMIVPGRLPVRDRHGAVGRHYHQVDITVPPSSELDLALSVEARLQALRLEKHPSLASLDPEVRHRVELFEKETRELPHGLPHQPSHVVRHLRRLDVPVPLLSREFAHVLHVLVIQRTVLGRRVVLARTAEPGALLHVPQARRAYHHWFICHLSLPLSCSLPRTSTAVSLSCCP